MSGPDDDLSTNLSVHEWLKQVEARREVQKRNIQYLKDNPHYDDDKIRRLDSTLKKVTGFMKRVKNIGTTVTPESLAVDLVKLNLSKFVDEIALSVVEAKMKIEELGPLVDFCVKASSIYAAFATDLVAEFKKRMPTRKSDEISNPAKLRVDLRFLADLVVNGIVGTDGIQLLGSVLTYLIQTDKSDHLNVSILLPFCRSSLYDCSGMVPLSVQESAMNKVNINADSMVSQVLKRDQRTAVFNLFKDYMESLLTHLNSVRVEMNGLLKYIKRQERTRGDASHEDRQRYDDLKNTFDRLLAQAQELTQWTGMRLPEMPLELSDDEQDDLEAKRLDADISEGRASIWPDEDTRLFYERIQNVDKVALLAQSNTSMITEDDMDNEPDEYVEEKVESEIDNVDVTDLDDNEETGISQEDDETSEKSDEIVPEEIPTPNNVQIEDSSFYPADHQLGPSMNISMFLVKLSNAINKERIDSCAMEFISHFNRKGNRKKLIQHLLAAPFDRLDLLPFYARFMATIKPAVPDVPTQVSLRLLERFREFARREGGRKEKAIPSRANCIDAKVHNSKYISELVKFGILPKAEALACVRALLIDLKHYKVDMLAAMVESMGLFLYRMPDTHAKMKVIVQVLWTKCCKLKDPRHKLLLENAYFCVVPPEEESIPLHRRPPMEEYVIMKVMKSDRPLGTLRRLDWSNDDVRDFTLSILTDACAVPFSELENLAKVVSALTDYHDWLGIYVVDDVLEYIRLALEVDEATMQQRLFSSMVYIGQLFNYTVCGTVVVFKVLYQLISYGINVSSNQLIESAQRTKRVRLAIELVNTIGEFFGEGRSKEKMDCFLNYLLHFYYETLEAWRETFAETFGEFPEDVAFGLDRMLRVFRPKEHSKFPKSLEEAKEAVQRIQERYKEKADSLLQNNLHFHHPDHEQNEEGPRRVNNIDADEEDDRIEDTPIPSAHGSDETSEIGNESSNEGGMSVDFNGVDEDEPEVHVVSKEQVVLPEDEDFMREFDRVLSETFQTSLIPKVPMVDLEVPPSARQKFERKITFADDVKLNGDMNNGPHQQQHQQQQLQQQQMNGLNNAASAFQTNHVSPQQAQAHAQSQQQQQPSTQMALMTRKGNRTVLKAVNLESSRVMHEAWREYQNTKQRERKEMKQLTLAMDERMYQQQQMDGER